MSARHRRGIVAVILVVLSSAALGGLLVSAQGGPPQAGGAGLVSAELRARAERNGRVRVIVELRLPGGPFAAEPQLPAQAVAAQRRAIETVAARVSARVAQASGRVVRQFQTVPFVALEVTPAGLAALEASGGDVVRVMDDAVLSPALAASAPHVQADQAWDVGLDGDGTIIAVLDTGVDAAHPFFAGKIVEEACFSTTSAGLSRSFCPAGLDEQFGAGAAAPCVLDGCYHGTHVAGIAAGSGASAGVPFSGVAKGARLVAVQVFSEILDPNNCAGGLAPCAGAFTTDVIAALEHVYSRRAQYNIAAVNMSLAGGLFTAACDDLPFKPAIDNLRASGIASIAATGNSGSPWSIGAPACVSTAVSVAAVGAGDTMSWFSNVLPSVSLLAPGEFITGPVPGGSYAPLSGTSMAAPHVAGAWAILRQASPTASVDTLLSALTSTGLQVPDTRFFGSATVPRIRTYQALAAISPVVHPAPAAASVSPSRVRAGQANVTFTIDGSGFNAFSVVLWNGAPRAAAVVSSKRLQVAMPPADLSPVGQAQIAVFTPGPGGGTSAPLTVTIDPPPTLTVNTTSAATGSPVTVTLTNGLGGGRDWLALAAVGAPNNQYVYWTYVGEGVTNRTWTVNMPSTAGTYEFRLFLTGGGSALAATSPAITVAVADHAVPSISTISPATAPAGGAAFTLTVNGTGFVSSSVVRWNGVDRPTTFHGSTQLRAAIAAEDIAAPGSASVTVSTPPPGGGTSAPAQFTIGTAPTLTVSATTVPTNSNVTVTLTDGLGGNTDWLAFAPTGAPNNSYLKYTYVGSGVTTRTWTVTTPLTTGTYEFRLFVSGYTRAATSPPITVIVGPSPVPVLSSISPTAGVVGSDAFTLTAIGSGFAPSSVVRWNGSDRPTTYVSSTQLRASISAADMASQGTAQITVFTPDPGGGTSAAKTFTIGSAPVLSVSATSVAPGASVTVTLTNGLGGQGDWLGLAATGAPNNSYLRYRYLPTGATTATWTVTMPTTPGTYEFRLFLNNGYTRAATSPVVTVQVQ